MGYHIIRVIAHEDAHLAPFEQVKAQLAASWKNDRVNDIVQQISDKAQAALQKDPLHPDEIAAQFHMQVVRADGVRAGQPLPEIGTNNDFDQSIATLKQGQVSQPVALPGNKLALAVVTGVIPSRPNTLAEVENQVRESIVQSRLAAAVQDPRQGTCRQGQGQRRRPGGGSQRPWDSKSRPPKSSTARARWKASARPVTCSKDSRCPMAPSSVPWARRRVRWWPR